MSARQNGRTELAEMTITARPSIGPPQMLLRVIGVLEQDLLWGAKSGCFARTMVRRRGLRCYGAFIRFRQMGQTRRATH